MYDQKGQAAFLFFSGDAFVFSVLLKSKLAPGIAKNNTAIYEAPGDNVKVRKDGTYAVKKMFSACSRTKGAFALPQA